MSSVFSASGSRLLATAISFTNVDHKLWLFPSARIRAGPGGASCKLRITAPNAANSVSLAETPVSLTWR
jgi:hypothetical protein